MTQYIDYDLLLARCLNSDNERMIKEEMEGMEFAEVAPILQGKWIRNNVSLYYKCSNCKISAVMFPFPFCPVCGAKMENGKNAWFDYERR